MAEFVNSIGQVRGKFGNVVAYVRANGKNYCKGASISRKPSTESQKQQAAAFAVVVSGWLGRFDWDFRETNTRKALTGSRVRT